MGKVWDVLAPRNLELGPLAGHKRAPSPWRNWILARDDDGIAWLALDKADASANTLSEDVLAELNDVLAHLERDMPKGLVLRSAKPKGFIAGADIGEFRGMTEPAEIAVPAEPERLTIQPWPDPVIDQVGHDPRSAYVEHFWLGVLGPSTIWLMRRLASGFERTPDGFDLDPVETAASLGLAARGGPQSPVRKSLDRACTFGVARLDGPGDTDRYRRGPGRGRDRAVAADAAAEEAEEAA